MTLSLDMILLAGLVFGCAGLIHGSMGFGFPMVATPLLALVTDIQTAILITLVPTVYINAASIASEGDVLKALKTHYSFALLAMAGSAVGTQILIMTGSEAFKLVLAFAILVYLAINVIPLRLPAIRHYPKVSKIGFGLLAGFVGGLTNVMAPVLIIYTLELNRSKTETIQSANICFLFGKTIQLILFAADGQVTLPIVSLSFWNLIATSMALYAGLCVRKKIHGPLYQKLLKGLLLILAALLVGQTLL